MSKICIIGRCSDCPYMDNEYYSYTRYCSLLDKTIKEDMCDIHNEIYKECPLKDSEE